MFTWLRFFLFLLPAEWAHNLGLWGVRLWGEVYRLLGHDRRFVETPVSTVLGALKSPVGLAAGMDKDGVALWGWQAMGFGFVEVGTVTPLSQAGNPQPRLFRLVSERALINRMGFNNNGVELLVARIQKAKEQGLRIPVGVNIGKNKDTPLEQAALDYGRCAEKLKKVADYLVINVSSPNTPGLRELQTEENLQKIISAVKAHSGDKPLFIKVAPDHFTGFQEGVLNVMRANGLTGVICGNTLAGHGKELQGGMSGRPVFHKNLELASSYKEKAPELTVIGVGGISSALEAQEYMKKGCSLIQIYTGLVYQGPGLVRDLNVALKPS